MGVYVSGRTIPQTGWRDWSARLAGVVEPVRFYEPARLGGVYRTAAFAVPTVTDAAWWGNGGYKAAQFAVPSVTPPGQLGALGQGGVLDWIERNKWLLLAGGALLFASQFKLARRRRRRAPAVAAA